MPLKHVDKGYNIFEMWTDPRNTVKAAVENPNIPLSIFAFLLPNLIIVINMLILGVQINATAVLFNTFRELIVFVLAVGVLYLFARNFLKEKGVFWRCFAALSLSRVVYALFLILSLVFLLIHGSFAADLTQSINGQISPQDVLTNALSVDSFPRDVAVFIFLILNFFFLIWFIYAQFLAIKETVSDDLGTQLIVLFAFLIGSYLINLAVSLMLTFLVFIPSVA